MLPTLYQFAATSEESSGGIAALGINLQGFLFQLVTFIVVLLLLRQFVYKRLVATLEERRLTVVQSLDQAQETAKKLESTNKEAAKLIATARKEADEIIATSQKEAASIVEAAQDKAHKSAEAIVTQAHAQIESEVSKARARLRTETAELVALATEKIIGEKIDTKKDAALINQAMMDGKS